MLAVRVFRFSPTDVPAPRANLASFTVPVVALLVLTSEDVLPLIPDDWDGGRVRRVAVVPVVVGIAEVVRVVLVGRKLPADGGLELLIV